MVIIREMKLEEAECIREIDRSEQIEAVYTLEEGQLKRTKAGHECARWSEGETEDMIARFIEELEHGGKAYGAFDGETLVGFSVLGHQFRGDSNNQLQVDLMYVTRAYRRQGIGRRMMERLSEEARARGAEYLYISSTETESAVQFYFHCGSEMTERVDPELFAKEPYDIHMLKKL